MAKPSPFLGTKN